MKSNGFKVLDFVYVSRPMYSLKLERVIESHFFLVIYILFLFFFMKSRKNSLHKYHKPMLSLKNRDKSENLDQLYSTAFRFHSFVTSLLPSNF